MDGIISSLLQEVVEILAPIFFKLHRTCIAFGHIPIAWRNTKVNFISRTGRDEGKSFRPISLTFFLLKKIEKLIDRYIRECLLVASPLSESQNDYLPGKSTHTALYNFSSSVETCLYTKKIALAVF